MLRATLRSLLARKLRLLLASFAILLGVSFVSGAFVLTDSLSNVFQQLFTSINKGTAVTVQSSSALEEEFGEEEREPIRQAVADRVARVDGVAEVLPQIGGQATLVLPNGKALVKRGPPVLVVGLKPESPQSSLTIKRGVMPRGPTQVALDTQTAAKQHIKVGAKVGVIGKGPRRTMTVVGLLGTKDGASRGGATILGVDQATAQRLLDKAGAYNELSLAADPGVTNAQLRDRVAKVLPKGIEAVTVEQTVAKESASLKEDLGFFNTFLLAFAGISLFVGAFLIFNTFSMLVAQRTRELALMRALGASRGQITRSVVVEAVVVGMVSSLAGFVLGIGLAVGLGGVLRAFGIELPEGDTVVRLRTFVVCLLVGVVITVLAAFIPARRASKVSPVQAMRESGPAEDRSLLRRTLIGSVILAVGAGCLIVGLGDTALSDGSLQLVGLGAALSFIGVTTLSPLFARPVAGLLGWPFARLGAPGRLGRGNAMRSPRRTSATAAALMIGLALVAMVSTLGQSVKESLRATVASTLGADYVLNSGFMPFSPAVAEAVKGTPGLAAVVPVRAGQAKIGEAGISYLQGIDPSGLQQVIKVTVLHGDLQALTRGGIAVSEKDAKKLGLKVGKQVPVTWARTGTHPLEVVAVYKDNNFVGGYLVSDKTFDQNVTNKDLVGVAIKAKSGTPPAQSRAALEKALSDYPNIDILDQAELIAEQDNEIDNLLNAVTGLLVLSVLIAILGIINTLALSVVERTRELGLLRAVGLQRRQVRWMILSESVVIAVYGAILGILIGLAFGWAMVSALRDEGITEFAVPVSRLLIVLAVGALGGVLAALLPARRAARMDVLQAIATT